jgi:hypothetical protein
MIQTIVDEGALLIVEIKLLGIIGVQIQPARTTKCSEKRVGWSFVKQLFKWRKWIKNGYWQAINKKNGHEKSLIPKHKRHERMGKESNTTINNVALLSFRKPILLMSLGARN